VRRSSTRLIDVYQVLGAERTDSWQQLRRHYRARARELHPDVQVHRQGHQRLDPVRATRLFSQLQAAWALVDTPERRAAYDLVARDSNDLIPKRPPRSRSVPSWSAGPKAAVLLRSGPGDLHIAVPGGGWDLSLAQFAAEVAAGRLPPLLIGDLPPHRDLRQAMRGVRFVERHRLTTMVGLEETIEEREPAAERGDDDGAWKLAQIERAISLWTKTFPGRRAELPYGTDLLLMGRLSLSGYELNLPHPAGLVAATESRPATRAESQLRRAESLLEVRIPAPTLLLVALWSGDQELAAALSAGGLAMGGSLPGDLAALQRQLAARRPRADHFEPLWGSVLDRHDAIPDGLAQLALFEVAWEWLHTKGQLPVELPWGEPASRCGRDRRLSDAAARLVSHVLEPMLDALPEDTSLVALQGPALRLRTPPAQRQTLAEHLSELLPALLQAVLRFPVEVTVV
jgi:curved DNA-binding protein CbpA